MTGDLLRVRLQLRPDERLARFVDASEAFETIELDNAIYAGDGQWFEYLTFVAQTDDASPESTLASLPTVEVLDSRRVGTDPSVYHAVLLVEEGNEFILPTITHDQAVPHRILLDRNRLRAVVTLRDWNHLKKFGDTLENAYDDFELLGTTQVETLGFPLGGDKLKHTMRGKLTDEQLLALEVAYRMGYFRVPQDATGAEVADRLETSQSAVSERLRRAQQRLFDVLFGPSE